MPLIGDGRQLGDDAGVRVMQDLAQDRFAVPIGGGGIEDADAGRDRIADDARRFSPPDLAAAVGHAIVEAELNGAEPELLYPAIHTANPMLFSPFPARHDVRLDPASSARANTMRRLAARDRLKNQITFKDIPIANRVGYQTGMTRQTQVPKRRRSRAASVLQIFISASPRRAAIVTVLLLLAGFAESIGYATLLPVLSVFMGDTAGPAVAAPGHRQRRAQLGRHSAR